MKYLFLICVIIILAGCNKIEEQRRIVCDDGFATPWVKTAYVDDGGIIKWYNQWDNTKYYKIPEGVTCMKKYRKIEVKL